MRLPEFTKKKVRNCGGIEKIWLLPARKLKWVVFDRGGGTFSELAAAEPGDIYSVEFAEDSAVYREEVKYSGKVLTVQHTLSFTLNRFDRVSSDLIREICRNPAEGFIAVVQTRAPERFLVGYDQRLGTAAALTLSAVGATTGAVPVDTPRTEIVLVSVSESPAVPFTGDVK